MNVEDRRLPRACWWPEPITEEEFRAFAPGGLELADGYLLGGEDADERRVALLAVLLRNCGLEKAVRLADPFLWKEALNRWQLYADFGLDDDPYSPYQDDD